MSIKILQFFIKKHNYLIHHYKNIGIFIESTLIVGTGIILFLNEEITTKFIVFLANTSQQVHSNKIVTLIILLSLYYCIELYESLTLSIGAIKEKSIYIKLRFDALLLLIKSIIIIGSAFGFIHPILEIFNTEQLKQLDTLILSWATTEIFVFIHRLIIMVMVLWIILGMYKLYQMYKE